MTQENTKLCDFFNTNNNDFISTPISPPTTSAESCDINAALLNLVMKDQFAGTPNEDVMTHKYRGSIVVLSISKSVEPNEEQKEMTSSFQ